MSKIRKYTKAMKKITAIALTAAMAVSGLPGLGGIEAKAAVLENNTSLMNANVAILRKIDGSDTIPSTDVETYTFGHSNNTSYAFGWSSDGTNGLASDDMTSGANKHYTFNIAMYDAGLVNQGYGDFVRAREGVTYRYSWFPTYYSFNTPASGAVETTYPTATTVGHGTRNTAVKTLMPQRKNGEVVTLQDGATPKVEVRQSIMPSSDGEYVILEYTVKNISGGAVDFMIGNESDTMLSNHDDAPLLMTPHGTATKNLTAANRKFEGIHFHATKDDALSTFDIIAYQPGNPYDLGISTRDGSDPSTVNLWIGNWQQTAGVNHHEYVFSDLKAALLQSGDSAAGFSAYFNLLANEEKTARFALALKKYVYYTNGSLGLEADADPNHTGGIDTGYMGGPVQAGNSKKNIGGTKTAVEASADDKKKSSIERAIAKAKAKGRTKIYIMVQANEEIEKTIEIPEGMEVHLQAADVITSKGVTTIPREDNRGSMTWNFDTNSIPKADGTSKTLTRASTLTSNPMFYVKGKLVLSNIKLDGANVVSSEPLVEVGKTLGSGSPPPVLSYGKLEVKPKTEIVNADATGTWVDEHGITIEGNKAAAIHAEAGATLSILGGTIKDNKSKGENGAAIIKDGGAITMSTGIEQIMIKDNTNETYKKNTANVADPVNDPGQSNILLVSDTNKIQLTGGTDVSSEVRFRLASNLVPNVRDQGRLIVEGGTHTYSASSFKTDNLGALVGSGNTLHTALPSGNQVAANVYLEPVLYTISVQVVDEAGNALATGASWNTTPNPISGTQLAGNADVNAGREIDWTYPTLLSDTKKFESLTVGGVLIQDTATPPANLSTYKDLGFNVGGGALGTPIKIKGKMPAENLVVTVKFRTPKAVTHIDLAGGITSTTQTKFEETINSSATVSTLGNLPVPTKSGMLFAGWKEFTDANDNHTYDSTETMGTTTVTAFPAPTGEFVKHYVATWAPDTTPYAVSKSYRNMSTTPSLDFVVGSALGTEPGANFILGASITEDSPEIPGYKFNMGTSAPSGGDGAFALVPSTTKGRFTKTNMPASAHDLTYRFTVDPTQVFNLTVEHKTGTSLAPGLTLATSTVQKKAEAPLALNKGNYAGYNFVSANIEQGAMDDAANYKLGLNASQGLLTSTGYAADGILTGFMPNQDVKVVFYYAADSASAITRRFLAEGNPVHADSLQFQPMENFGTTPNPPIAIPQHANLYGYAFDPARPNAFSFTPAGATITSDAAGAISGTMPGTGGINVTYDLAKDPTKWNNLHFDFVTGLAAFGTMDTHGPIYVLTDDGVTPGHENAPNFATIQGMTGFPTVTPDHYHMIEGWYTDVAGTNRINDSARLMTNASGQQTIYVKLVEDPSKWVDVSFETADASKGSVNPIGTNVPGGSPQHMKYDTLWSAVVVPGTTPIANYELKNWITPNGTIAAGTDRVIGGTYKANFGKVNATWGIDPGAFAASGTIAPDESGTVTVTGVTPGNVYVVTDPDGNIVGVTTGPADGSDINFPNLVPGRTYQVREGGPDTTATVGQPESGITGSSVSAPKPVLIPAIGDNRNVGVDPNNPERAQIVVNPADPDAEYSLIDSQGNVVTYPDAPDGWKTPVGTAPPKVTFNDLNPGETYTVVARKKNNPSETPLGNIGAGVPVLANPGDMVEAPKYIIETKTNGIGAVVQINTVGTDTVNAPFYDQAKANTEFTIHADPVDGAGHAFKHWVIQNGRIPGVTAKILTTDYSGKLASSNVIFRAVYDVPHRDASGNTIAPAEEANRGNATEGEFAMDPSTIPALENALTNPTDQSLINTNGADVRYKIIYDKRRTKMVEDAVIKAVPSLVWQDHPEAFTTAYSLDIKEERYVDGRLVQNASPSNAAVKVNVQLPAADTDMLDYELWDLGLHVDSTWNPVAPTMASQIVPTEDIENNAGYLSFDGNLNHTYVLVYAKTFKLYFIDNNPSLDHVHLGDTSKNFFKKIKVRKKDSVEDTDYAADYAVVTGYTDGTGPNSIKREWHDIYGITYNYVDWSKRDMPAAISIFDPGAEVTRTMSIFAYYDNNRTRVSGARTQLTNLIPEARNLTLNPFLISEDVAELNEAIARAQNVLDRIRGRLENGIDPLRMAIYPELQAAIDDLQRVMDKMNGKITERSNKVYARTGGASGGGSGSPGRGGGGSSGTPLEGTSFKNLPLSSTPQITFTLGVDGGWEINPMTGRWSFVLNGGLPLNQKWARIDYRDSDGEQITDWYRFDAQSSLVTGWYFDDETRQWFLLNTQDGKDLGKMIRGWHKDPDTQSWYYLNKEGGTMTTGWHRDPDDGRWYYLDPATGRMATGWVQIGGKWYFFNQNTPESTWRKENNKWIYENKDVRPFGSMYEGETTPDGYRVSADGEWIR